MNATRNRPRPPSGLVFAMALVLSCNSDRSSDTEMPPDTTADVQTDVDASTDTAGGSRDDVGAVDARDTAVDAGPATDTTPEPTDVPGDVWDEPGPIDTIPSDPYDAPDPPDADAEPDVDPDIADDTDIARDTDTLEDADAPDDVDGPWEPPLLDCGAPIIAPPRPDAVPGYLVYVEQPGGHADVRIASSNGSEPARTVFSSDDALFLYPQFSLSGGLLAAVRVDVNGTAILVLDLRCGEVTEVVAAGEFDSISSLSWQGDETLGFVVGTTVDDAPRAAYTVDVETGDAALLYTAPAGERVDAIAWGGGRWAVLTSDAALSRAAEVSPVARLLTPAGIPEGDPVPATIRGLLAIPDQSAVGFLSAGLARPMWLIDSESAPSMTTWSLDDTADCAVAAVRWRTVLFYCSSHDVQSYEALPGPPPGPVPFPATDHLIVGGVAMSPAAANAFVLTLPGDP